VSELHSQNGAAIALFVAHDVSMEGPASLVVRLFGVDGLTEDDIACTRSAGSAILGRVTHWWRWSILPGAPDAIFPSTLEEDDPDDAPFPTRCGLVVFIEGTTSGYVGCGPMLLYDEGMLRRQIMSTATHPFFSPVNDFHHQDSSICFTPPER
jgi:hypothetical protein